MDEILDHDENSERVKLFTLKYIGLATIFYFVGIIIIGSSKLFLPENLYEHNGVALNSVSILAFVFLAIYPRILMDNLNKIFPNLTRFKLVLFVSLSILIADLIYRNMQQFMLQWYAYIGESNKFNWIAAFILPVIISILGGLFSWSRISKLRNKNVSIPNLTTAAFCFLIYFLLKY